MNQTSRILDVFSEEIRDIANDVLKRAGAAAMVRLDDDHRSTTAFQLDAHNRTPCEFAVVRLRRLMSSFACVLQRRGASSEADAARQLFYEFESYVRLEQKVADDVWEPTWRTRFAHEVSEHVNAILRLMEHAQMLGVGHPHEPKLYEDYHISFSTRDSARLRDTLSITTAEGIGGVRRIAADYLALIGQELFQNGIGHAVPSAYTATRDTAVRRGRGMRIRLYLPDEPNLAELPWEVLHDGRQFLSLSRDVSIVRVLRPNTVLTRPFSPPTRILVTVSSPRSLAHVDAELEIAQLEAAVYPLVLTGKLELAFVRNGALDTTRRKLQSASAMGKPFDAWHFIGHGIYDDKTARGKLAMTGANGDLHLVTSWELRELFADHAEVRFAFLNSCDSSRGDPSRPNSTIAMSLLDLGMDAVIAMQLPLAESSAITFASELYGAMADGAGLDEAVTSARQAVFFSGDLLGWIAPVVFI